MKEYTKEELVQEFGKRSWLNVDLVQKVEYLSGIDFFDKKRLSASAPINLKKYPNGFVIEAMSGFSYCRAGISIEKIKYLVIEKQEQIIEQKSKSVVGRALVGGLLLGPLGAVVGGMSGMGTKTKQLSDFPDNILTICIDDNGRDGFILFAVKNKNLKEVTNFLKTSFPKVYKQISEIAKLEIVSNTNNNISVADEIKKLKELLYMGAISQAEFEQQKSKLLDK